MNGLSLFRLIGARVSSGINGVDNTVEGAPKNSDNDVDCGWADPLSAANKHRPRGFMTKGNIREVCPGDNCGNTAEVPRRHPNEQDVLSEQNMPLYR